MPNNGNSDAPRSENCLFAPATILTDCGSEHCDCLQECVTINCKEYKASKSKNNPIDNNKHINS